MLDTQRREQVTAFSELELLKGNTTSRSWPLLSILVLGFVEYQFSWSECQSLDEVGLLPYAVLLTHVVFCW